MIVEANFLKDKGDFMGAQDPLIQFEWLGEIYRTPTLENAGKYGYFGAEFWLNDFLEAREETVKFEALDDDGLSAEMLGATEPFVINQILEGIKEIECEPLQKIVSLFDENGQESGDIQVIFELYDSIGNRYKEEAPPEIEIVQQFVEKDDSEANPFQAANLSQLMNQENYPMVELEDMDPDKRSTESQALKIPSHNKKRKSTKKKRMEADETLYSHEGSDADNLDTKKPRQSKKRRKEKSSKKAAANNAKVHPMPAQPVKKNPTPGGVMGGKFGMLGKQVDDDDFFEPLSYKKLKRMITENHPVDPDTKSKLSLTERITVKDYFPKIMDACCVYRMRIIFKKFKKILMKRFKDDTMKF